MWDWIVFSKVQNTLGGRVRVIVTGSAPISAKVMDFLRCAFGCLVSPEREREGEGGAGKERELGPHRCWRGTGRQSALLQRRAQFLGT